MTEDEKEFIDERTAIAMYDAGMGEWDAKEFAYTCYIHKFRPDCVTWYPWPVVS